MAETPSTMLPLGTVAPDFQLLDVVTKQIRALSTLQGTQGTVIMFICNHCPYVKYILPALLSVIKEYQTKGIAFVAISANDVANYPDDSPEHMKRLAEELGFTFPYLYDESQATAKAYHAACTPDFYLFDHALQCVYRGRFVAATPANNQPITGHDLRQALDALLAKKEISKEQHPSLGCNIKWKKIA